MSKRGHYMVQRYGRRYGPKGALFVGRAWREATRYFEGGLWGDTALSRMMDQVVRLQKLGRSVITDEHREAALAAVWEAIEKVQQHADGTGKDQPADGMTGWSPEVTDYWTHVYDPKDREDIHEVRVEPAYIPPEIAPVRHSQEAWEALREEVQQDPEGVVTTVKVLWQLWRLRGGSKFLSCIN